jgi:hypothetical protein
MKENILIVALLVLILGTSLAEIGVKASKDRYEVVTAPNMLTILVDKTTGETWRNCICSEKSNVPGCWEKMATINPEEFNKPVGEAKAVKKMIKLQQKLAKQQPIQQSPINGSQK